MRSSLEGKRIRIRKLALSDAPAIYGQIRHRAISRWILTVPFPYPKSAARVFIQKSTREWKQRKAYQFAIVLKETGRLIGG